MRFADFIRQKLRREPLATPGLPGAAVFVQRLGHVNEELGELTRAYVQGDVVKFADGVADAVYILYGLAADSGIDLDEVLAEVHRSNMTKKPLDADGKGGKNHPGFEPADVARVLAGQMRKAPPDLATCWQCLGTGRELLEDPHHGHALRGGPCPTCQGAGRRPATRLDV